LYKYVDPKEIADKTGLAFPHTAHCLATGEILVSCLGDEEGNAKGNGFLLLDSDFNIKNRYLIAKQIIFCFSFLSLLVNSHIPLLVIVSGGRNQDIVLCMGMIFGTNLGTRP